MADNLWQRMPPFRNIPGWIIFLTAAILSILFLKTEFNMEVFYLVNGISNYTGTLLWSNITILGDTLVILVLILPWIKRDSDFIWALLFVSVAAFFLSHGLKNLLLLPRPAGVLDRETINIIGPVLKRRAFPSGHTTTIFTAVFLLMLYKNKAAHYYLLAFGGVLVAVSRIVVCAHWPADIFGGIATAALSVAAGLQLFQLLKDKLKPVHPAIVPVILIFAAIYQLFFYDTRYPQALILQQLIAVYAIVNSVVFLYSRHLKN